MDKINFKGVEISSLGFGCSLLSRNKSIKAALTNLETAFDNGITHFDAARLYGFGEAETILGKFAKGKRTRITISSKSGLKGFNFPLGLLPFVNLFRALAKNVKSKASEANLNHFNVVEGRFDPETIKDDLNTSLKKIGTDYIDFYLLHEANISQANREDIVDTLVKLKDAGKIRSLGLASNFKSFYSDISSLNDHYTIIQHSDQAYEYNIRSLQFERDQVLRIVYNIFSRYNKIKEYIERDNLELDPLQIVLSYYKDENKNGVTLFSATNNSNIIRTVKEWNDLSASKNYIDLVKDLKF